MKKYLLLAILLVPFFAKAEAPSGVFGFLDGKYYDESQSLKYICFLDNNCYDLSQKFAFQREVKGAVAPEPSFPIINPVTSQPLPVPVVTPHVGSVAPVPTPAPAPVTPVSNLLPAYTEEQLLQKFYEQYPEHPNMPGKPNASFSDWTKGNGSYWPISLSSSNITDTSVVFGFQGLYNNYKHVKVIFNNQIVSSVPIDGENPIHITSTGLTPGTIYTYQVIYMESGRHDTVITRSFRTLN